MTEDDAWDRINQAFPEDEITSFIDLIMKPAMRDTYEKARHDAADAIGAHARTLTLQRAKPLDLKAQAAFDTAEKIARTGRP